jgi:hypothetical protein
MIFLGLWLLCGAVTFGVAVWINPEGYGAEDYSDDELTLMKSAATVVVWPVAIFVYTLNQLRKALLRTKKEKLKLRAELEKDLAAARREVEDLLRSARK